MYSRCMAKGKQFLRFGNFSVEPVRLAPLLQRQHNWKSDAEQCCQSNGVAERLLPDGIRTARQFGQSCASTRRGTGCVHPIWCRGYGNGRSAHGGAPAARERINPFPIGSESDRLRCKRFRCYDTHITTLDTGLGGGQRGACNVPPPRGQQAGNGPNARRHSLDRLHASMIKQKKKKKKPH